MGQFTIKVDHEQKTLPTALGISDERAEELGAALWNFIKEEDENKDNRNFDIMYPVEKILEKCENIQEVVFMVFGSGSYFNKRNTDPLESIINNMFSGE